MMTYSKPVPKKPLCVYSYVADIIDEAVADEAQKAKPSQRKIEGLKDLKRICAENSVVFAAQLLALQSPAFSSSQSAFSAFFEFSNNIRKRLPPEERFIASKEAMGAQRLKNEDGTFSEIYPRNPVEAIRQIRKAYSSKGVDRIWPRGLMSQTVDRFFPASRYFEGTISAEFYELHKQRFLQMNLERGQVKFSKVLSECAEARYELAQLLQSAVSDITKKVLLKQEWQAVANPGPVPIILRPTPEGLEALNNYAPNETTEEIQQRVIELSCAPQWGQNLLEVLERRRLEAPETPIVALT